MYLRQANNPYKITIKSKGQNQPDNWFPLNPMQPPTTFLREICQMSNPAHIPIEPQGTIINMRRGPKPSNHTNAAPFTHTRRRINNQHIYLATGNLDYHERFTPVSFIHLFPPLEGLSGTFAMSITQTLSY